MGEDGGGGGVSLLHHHAHAMDFFSNRCTPLDYARLHGHNLCADLLVEAGGLVSSSIKEMAAITIEANFRGHMYVEHCVCSDTPNTCT